MKLPAVVSSILLLIIAVSNTSIAQETVKSKLSTELYGFIKFETIYDNTEVAQGDWLLYAYPDSDPISDQDVFTMNARHSRLGLKFDGPDINKSIKVRGLIEVDFAGGFPNSSTAARQPNLRLRHAWVELDRGKCSLLFGQDWALISGPFPNTTSFVVGAGKGNLWMRYPQIKYTQKMNAFKFAVSANRPMAGNVKYEDFSGGDFDPVGDGERSGMPWWMARVWYTAGPAVLSVSGHYGQEQINDASGNPHDVATNSINADAVVTAGALSFTARIFTGENLNSFFGGVFQGYATTATTVENVASRGGWGQLAYKFNSEWSATLGGGFDDPDDQYLAPTARDKNDWLFGNVAFSPASALSFMLETENLKTTYVNGSKGDNLRLQFVTYYKF